MSGRKFPISPGLKFKHPNHSMKPVIVVLPVYKPFSELNESELLSLKQLKLTLYKYPLSLVAGEKMPTEDYLHLLDFPLIKIERFEDCFFASIKAYNSLCLSKNFYKRFLDYHFMLIYQTDAFVFKDELSYWLKQNYHFIGAPSHIDNTIAFDKNTWVVGNGGFSLRSVKKCYQLLNKIGKYNLIVKLLDKIYLKTFVAKASIKLNLVNLSVIASIAENRYNEDFVFSVLSKQISKQFAVAPIEEAIQFSFEAHPSLLYEMNDRRLPFGCHAWDRYETDFWEQFIQQGIETEIS